MLQVNTVVKYFGTLCRVSDVTDSRAVLTPLSKKQSEDSKDKFGSMPRTIVVSPNAELSIVNKAGKRGEKWLKLSELF